MKTIQYSINLCYYHCFLMTKAWNNWFNSLFMPLYRLNFVRRRCQKFGIEDSYEWMKERVERQNNPAQGLVIGYTSRFFGIWLAILIIATGNIFIQIFDTRIYDIIFSSILRTMICFLTSLPIALLIMWIFIEKNDKYLVYFRYFESLDDETKRRNRLLACVLYLLSFAYVAFSIWLVFQQK